jgi:hypothetical protein
VADINREQAHGGKQAHGLRFRPVWAGLGALMIAVVIALSLVSVSGPVTAAGADKVYHSIAYGALMFWWGMVQPRRRWTWAVLLAALGVGLEVAQSFTGYRTLDNWDALANSLGVLGAVLLLLTPAAGLLAWFDGQLADRFNPRRP